MLRNDRNVIYFGNKVVRQWTVAAGIVERSPVRVHQITPRKLVNNSLDESWEWCSPPAIQPASLRCLIRGDQSVVRMSNHTVEDHWAGVDNPSINKIIIFRITLQADASEMFLLDMFSWAGHEVFWWPVVVSYTQINPVLEHILHTATNTFNLLIFWYSWQVIPEHMQHCGGGGLQR